MRSIEEIVSYLIEARVRAGSPSYAELARRVTEIRADRGVVGYGARVSRSTVYDAFDRTRRRLDAALVADLNQYFAAMTAIVEAHGGFVDKFIGDAVYAAWGAPLPQADHAERAVRAAWRLSQVARLDIEIV